MDLVFLRSHSVSTFSDSYTGIAGQLSRVSHQYTALTTEFNLVDWDGNILCRIDPPYYISSGYCQAIDVKDKTYLIVTAYSMYPKIVDCQLPHELYCLRASSDVEVRRKRKNYNSR